MHYTLPTFVNPSERKEILFCVTIAVSSKTTTTNLYLLNS